MSVSMSMELITSCNCNTLQFQRPFHAVASSFSLSQTHFPHSLSTRNYHTLRFHPPLPTSPSHTQSLSTTCSVANDSTLNPETKELEPSLALKKAMDIAPDLKGTSIFLVGMKSSIKTSLGKLLAGVLRYYYFDSDGLVEEAAGGESAAKSLKESDEKAFCESETEVLKQLSSMGRLVICAGDGAVQSSTNLAFLRHGISICVDVPLDMVAREVIKDQSQLSDSEIYTSEAYSEVLTQLIALHEEMRGGYGTADATVSLQKAATQLGYDDMDAVTIEDMTLEVLKEIEKLTRVKKLMEEAARPF
ncbi:probable inactive shikimate kinase like 1, chloroplastic isoform X2 [Quercus robur]|uniref:probable inactive shikimate kinase like 1, chloroplastic isoform X2 n=1 Tax=Quercus robur TaxID=38942 RepID=UPI0021613213|nr:probable inactive shikimate kinase like 1, chloroplastic isoform X2 [Quercus robur]